MVSSRMILDTRAQRRNVQRFKKTIQFSRLESNHLMMLSFKMIPDTGVGNCLPKRYRTFFRSRKVKEEPLDVLVSPVPSLITTILISAILYTTFISGATQGTRNMKYESIKFGGGDSRTSNVLDIRDPATDKPLGEKRATIQFYYFINYLDH